MSVSFVNVKSFVVFCRFIYICQKNPEQKISLFGLCLQNNYSRKIRKSYKKTPLMESCFSSTAGCGKNFQSSCSVEHRWTATSVLTLGKHCVKNIWIRSFFWSTFFLVRTGYEDLSLTSPYSVQMRENTDQQKLRIWALFTQWGMHTRDNSFKGSPIKDGKFQGYTFF